MTKREKNLRIVQQIIERTILLNEYHFNPNDKVKFAVEIIKNYSIRNKNRPNSEYSKLITTLENLFIKEGIHPHKNYAKAMEVIEEHVRNFIVNSKDFRNHIKNEIEYKHYSNSVEVQKILYPVIHEKLSKFIFLLLSKRVSDYIINLYKSGLLANKN